MPRKWRLVTSVPTHALTTPTRRPKACLHARTHAHGIRACVPSHTLLVLYLRLSTHTGAAWGGLRRRHPCAAAATALRHRSLLESVRDARQQLLERRHPPQPPLRWCALGVRLIRRSDGRSHAGRRVTPRDARQPAAPWCRVVTTQGAGHLRGEPGRRARRLRQACPLMRIMPLTM